jgi:aminopeptidase N
MSSTIRLFFIWLAFSASLTCAALNLTEQQTCSGVSKELAQMRKANYSKITYSLHFDVSVPKDSPVKGKVDILYTHPLNIDAVIDFLANSDQIISVAVNNKKIKDYTFNNEHIIINRKHLKNYSDQISIEFIAGSKPLNRNDEFIYTLLVPDRARTLFPCFDQPDLKATYKLSLNVPADWEALSNTSVRSVTVHGNMKHIMFAPTEPLSTYLFSFVTGKFTKDTRTKNGRKISAYYRETDPQKITQLDTIFSQVFSALDWQEKYTGIKYPFAKYDFVILPGFQFGGMEHTGATLYNDRMMFLGNHATPDEELSRAQLIAHETSHMWFGDLVTMAWFDDVWTKEVFANYFAAVITEPSFKDVNHTLNRINSFYTPAINEDRTAGTTAIQQPLDNLQNAGLIYNNIIYDKAPVVMFKIVDLMGAEAYQRGIRDYLKKYAYSNATWDNLIECLDAQTDADIKSFSEVWIKAKGMPTIAITPNGNGFDVEQSDPYNRGLLWPQTFTVKAIGKKTEKLITVDLKKAKQHYDLDFTPTALIPNCDGRGYAYFAPDDASLKYLTENWSNFSDEVMRMAAVMTLNENYHNHRFIKQATVINSFLDGLSKEKNPLIASALINNISFMCSHTSGGLRRHIELTMNNLAESMPLQSARLQMQRKLVQLMTVTDIVDHYKDMWASESNPLWSENDYTTAAYELAVRQPENADSILATQRKRITNQDRLKQFDFISRACTSNTAQLDELFISLQNKENRLIEPYAQTLLYYLNHPSRDQYSARYIEPGLELLSEVQRTGDIFFPAKWTQMLLGNHRCNEAKSALNRFLKKNSNYPTLLKNKILQAAYPLTFEY